MALDFPASPSVNQTYSGPGGVVWVWDGAKWVSGTGSTVYAPVTSPVFLGNPTAPNPPAGDADTSVATTSFVAAAVAPALGPLARSFIHNPLFNVAQRGVGPFTSAGYTADRWSLDFNLDVMTSCNISAVADSTRVTIGDEAASNYLFLNMAGNAGAAAYTRLVQRIESVRRLAGTTVTISFWGWCGAGSLKVGVSYDQIFGSGGSPSASVTGNGTAVTLSTTPARYSVTLTIPNAQGKTLGSTAGTDYTQIAFWLSSGTTQAVRAGSIGVQSGSFGFWGMQLEIGSVATPLEKPDPRYDLSNCQRMFCTGYVYNFGYGVAGNWLGAPLSYPVTMRTAPTVAFSGPTYSNCSGVAAGASTAFSFTPYAVVTATGGANFSALFTASADL